MCTRYMTALKHYGKYEIVNSMVVKLVGKKLPDAYYIKAIEPLYIICHLQTIFQKCMLQIQMLGVFIASENKHHK